MPKLLLPLAFLLLQVSAFCQQQLIALVESTPVTNNGITTGYDITGTSEKEVGNKGDFSRYKIHFYITNSGTDAKLILYKPNSSLFSSSASPEVAKFKCTNATGARLTSKEFALQAQPCTIDAMVEEKECNSDKTTKNRRPATIGYWIRPGETIASNTIVIVPLNQKPDINVTLFPGSNSITGTIINNNDNNTYNNTYQNQNYNNQSSSTQSFSHIRNIATNTYLHNQNGPVECSTINNDWWSAQWEILPVNGTEHFLIRNRWKNNYISTDNSSMLSDNNQSPGSQWTIEETGSNTYTIKNVGNNAKLVFQNGTLRTTTSFVVPAASQWTIE